MNRARFEVMVQPYRYSLARVVGVLIRRGANIRALNYVENRDQALATFTVDVETSRPLTTIAHHLSNLVDVLDVRFRCLQAELSVESKVE